tara:strand:- start:190 stop:786 length:597 start_codon:yes stop_codon:yes gene_type:complete
METKELFVDEPTTTTKIKVIDDIEDTKEDTKEDVILHLPITTKTKAKTKAKDKKPMDEERKKLLLLNLEKGRATAKKNRELLKEKAKIILQEKAIASEIKVKKVRAKKKVDDIQVETDNNNYLNLKKELNEIKQMLKDKTISEEKKEALTREKKEIVNLSKVAQKPSKPPTKIIANNIPVIPGYSTIRRPKRKQRLGF